MSFLNDIIGYKKQHSNLVLLLRLLPEDCLTNNLCLIIDNCGDKGIQNQVKHIDLSNFNSI